MVIAIWHFIILNLLKIKTSPSVQVSPTVHNILVPEYFLQFLSLFLPSSFFHLTTKLGNYLLGARDGTRLPRPRIPPRRAGVQVARPDRPVRLLGRVAHRLVHYGGGAVDDGGHRRHDGLAAEGRAVLETAAARRRALGPVAQHPRVLELPGRLPLRGGELVGDARVVDLAAEDDLGRGGVVRVSSRGGF